MLFRVGDYSKEKCYWLETAYDYMEEYSLSERCTSERANFFGNKKVVDGL